MNRQLKNGDVVFFNENPLLAGTVVGCPDQTGYGYAILFPPQETVGVEVKQITRVQLADAVKIKLITLPQGVEIESTKPKKKNRAAKTKVPAVAMPWGQQ